MHLCAIALYRYHGIAYPLHVRSVGQGRHVAALVGPAWLISVALSIPFVIQATMDRGYVLQATFDLESSSVDVEPAFQCGIFNHTFAIYSSLVSFFVPLAVMIFADIRSIQILRRHINIPLVRGSACRYRRPPSLPAAIGISPDVSIVNNQLDAATGSEASDAAMPRQTQYLLSDVTMTSIQSALLDVATKESNRHTVTNSSSFNTLSVIVPNEMTSPVAISINGEALNNCPSGDTSRVIARSSSCCLPPSGEHSNLSAANAAVPENLRRSRSRSMVYIDMLASCGKVRVSGRERRAEKTLIWVFAAFVVLWLPFFCTNLTYGLCSLDRGDGEQLCQIPPVLFQIFTWLGYLSSGVNPCIYTLLNKDFREAFKNILFCRYRQLRKLTLHAPSSVALMHHRPHS